MIIPNIKSITNKRLKQLERNSGSKRYQNWRDSVLSRDEFKCQYPRCDKCENLQVHHIKRFVDAKHLRYERFNGITLCVKHHQMISNNEGYYELMFLRIVLANESRYEKNSDNY
jgi:5-methylcytosine-specific restriction endonuclease McrA